MLVTSSEERTLNCLRPRRGLEVDLAAEVTTNTKARPGPFWSLAASVSPAWSRRVPSGWICEALEHQEAVASWGFGDRGRLPRRNGFWQHRWDGYQPRRSWDFFCSGWCAVLDPCGPRREGGFVAVLEGMMIEWTLTRRRPRGSGTTVSPLAQDKGWRWRLQRMRPRPRIGDCPANVGIGRDDYRKRTTRWRFILRAETTNDDTSKLTSPEH